MAETTAHGRDEARVGASLGCMGGVLSKLLAGTDVILIPLGATQSSER